MLFIFEVFVDLEFEFKGYEIFEILFFEGVIGKILVVSFFIMFL